MAENYLLNVDRLEDVAVRLVGFINEKECEAILNLEDAVRMISTAENINTKDQKDSLGKRFVLVIRIQSKSFGDNVPIIFISPVISQKSYVQSELEFGCHSQNESGKYVFNKYRFIPIKAKAGV